ncbi:MAG: AsmA family protein [Pseudobdellovibrionaceae bacterium]
MNFAQRKDSVSSNAPKVQSGGEVVQELTGFDDPKVSLPRVPKFAKYLAGTALGLIILAGVGGVVASQFIDQDKYKAEIVAKVKEATGYGVDWKGDISLALLPLPHASLRDVTVDANGKKFITIGSVDVSVNIAALLSGTVEVSRVRVQEPVVTFVTSQKGQQEWMAMPSSSKVSGDGSLSAAESEPASDSSSAFVVKSIEIEDGQVILDNQAAGTRTAIENINTRLRAESMSGPFDAEGKFKFSGQDVGIKMTMGESALSDQSFPLSLEVTLEKAGVKTEFSGVMKAESSEFSGDVTVEADNIGRALEPYGISVPPALSGRGLIAGKVTLSPDAFILSPDSTFSVGDVAYNGDVRVTKLSEDVPQISFKLAPRADGVTSQDPLVKFLDDLQISAAGSYSGSKLSITSSSVQLQGNDLNVSGKVDFGKNVPWVDVKIVSQKLDVDDIQSRVMKLDSGRAEPTLAAGDGTGVAASIPAKGFDLPFNGTVDVKAAKVTVQGQTYRDITGQVSAAANALTINSFSAALPVDSRVTLSGKIGDTQKFSSLDMKVSFKTSSLEEFAAVYQLPFPELPQTIGAFDVDTKIKGDLENTDFDVAAVAQKFTVKASGKVTQPLVSPVVDNVSFAINHPNFADAMRALGMDSGNPVAGGGALTIAGDLGWVNQTYRINNLHGALGGADFRGAVAVDLAGKPKIDGQMNIADLVLASSSSGKAGSGNASAPSKQAAGLSTNSGAVWSREAIDTSWMHGFDADINVTAKSITHNLLKFSNVKLVAKLEDGTLSVEDMSAGMFGGTASLNAIIKSGQAERDPLNVTAKLSAANVDAKSMVSGLMGRVNDTVSGTLTSFDTQISATGISPAALVQTLGGEGKAQGQNIIVKGIDAAQLAQAAKGSYKPMERAGAMFGSFGDGQTQFDIADAEYTIQNGIVQFSKLFFDGPKATLNSTGSLNLPQWTIDLKNTMTVKNTDIPPFDFSVRGPLDNPQKAGGDVIENYLQNKFEKKVNKLLEDKLGKFLGAQSEAAPVDETAAEGVDSATDTSADESQNSEADAKAEAAKQAVKALQGLFGK